MDKISMDTFYVKILDLIDKLYEKEAQNIINAAELCSNAIVNNGVIHVFGTGHSVGFGLEMKDRIGSLACIHCIETTDFVIKGNVSLSEFKDQNNIFERRPGIANKLYDLYDIRKEDIFIIISNSGINGLVIDMALLAKEKGHKIIVITSMEHTTKEDSRHPSGRKLYELGDIVIDNCGPQGDSFLPTDKENICSVSSITGGFIAQSLTIAIASDLMEKSVECPIFLGAQIEGADIFNRILMDKYQGRV